MQMIADGNIKEGTKLKNGIGTEFIYKNGTLYRSNYKDEYKSILSGGVYGELTYLLNNQTFEILEDKTEEIKEITINGRDVKYGSMYNWLGNCSIHEEKICSAIDTLAMKYNELVRAYNSLIKQQDTSKETNCMSE